MPRFSPIAQSLRTKASKKRLPTSEKESSALDAEALVAVQRHVQYLVWQLSDESLADTLNEFDTLCRDARIQPQLIAGVIRRAAAHAFHDNDTLRHQRLLGVLSYPLFADDINSVKASVQSMSISTTVPGFDGIQVPLPMDLSGSSALFDAFLAHISDHASQEATPTQLTPLLVSILKADARVPFTLDHTQRQQLMGRLSDAFGETAALALGQALSQLPSKPLAEQLIDLGDALVTSSNLHALIKHSGFSRPKESDVSDLLAQLLSFTTRSMTFATNFSLLSKSLAATDSALDWRAIMRGLDAMDSRVFLPCEKLGTALGDWIRGTPNPIESVNSLWGVWTNRTRQLQILYSLLLLSEHFSMKDVTARQIVSPSDFVDAPPTIQAQAKVASESVWNSLDLIETLMELANSVTGAENSSEVGRPVTAILERAIQTNAECVLLGLVVLPPSMNAVHTELVTKLLAMFLVGYSAHQLVFWHLWHTQPALLMDAFKRLYAESPLHMTRIVEVAQELGMINQLVSQQPWAFALDAAALAARRDALQLEPWLEESISAAPADAHLITATLDFLEIKIKEDLMRRDPQAEPTFVPLHVQQVAVFLRVLRGFGDSMSLPEIDHFKIVRNMCLQLHPRLMKLTPGPSSEPGLTVTTFSKDIHREADTWYRQMYEEKVSVDDIVSLLRRCKHSDDERDHQLFACMVHTLFDEHRWFELYYPPRELLMTAAVFGALVQYQLIESIPLGIAIRYVVDALQASPDSTLFHFGIQALLRFQKRLAEWPQLCQVLLSLPTLTQTHPELIVVVNQALAAAKSGKVQPPDDSVFTAIQPDALPADMQRKPDEVQSDQLLFLINNMSLANVHEKLSGARELVLPDILHWLARYLVLERVSLEPNNHDLYLMFLTGLEQPRVFVYVLYETLTKLKALLDAEKTTQSTSERTVLKNLASWLGLTTLAQERPILHRNLAFKDLLLQGYESGRLIVAIPFVCKVLEHCSSTRAFQPPNPWLMAILRLLVELYQFANLKLNLKFEIEVLCKSLHVDLQKLEPSQLLPGRRPEPPSGPSTAAVAGKRAASGDHNTIVPGMEQLSVNEPVAYHDMFVTMLQNMAQYIVISPQIVPYANSAAWKRVMYVALERAIQEIITPVVERSVTIASISTRELVSKDFAMEPDEQKLRSAAHLMAQNMAGSLALVTCKEPLRLSILAHARTLFAAGGVSEQALPEQALLLLVQDNLDLACVVIEKTAMEKALAKVDEGLANAYRTRRDFKIHGHGAIFWDKASLSHYSTTLPDLMRIAPPGLQPAQLRVYEQLAMTPNVPRQEDDLEMDDVPAVAGLNSMGMGSGFLMPTQALERFVLMAAELERFFAEVSETPQTLSTLPSTHFVRQVLPHLNELILQSTHRDETVLLIAQKTVQLLYKTGTDLAREVWVAVLEQLCEQSSRVAREVTAWLMYAEDERKFHVPVTLALVRANLISLVEQDQQLAKLLIRTQCRSSVVDYSAQLVRHCLQEGLATRAQFSTLLSALAQAVQYGRGTPAAQRLLDDLDELAVSESSVPLRDQLAYSFARWVRVFQQSSNPEKSFIEYIMQLQSRHVLKGEEVSSLFFRMCTEVSVTHYTKQHAVGGTRASGIFSPIDTFAQLIVYLIKYHADPSGTNDERAKVHYLTKILSIIVLVLAQSHEEMGAHFQQRPFFRLFSSMLHGLRAAESSLQGAYNGALLAIANALYTLQPAFFPGFAFSWVALVSHRLFLPQLLRGPTSSRAAFHRLMIAQLRFLSPLLRQNTLHDTTRLLYSSTLRLVLVLLHDFPEYLAEYHQSLCDVIPSICIQLRNLVLCAYPRPLRMPDPFGAGLRLVTWPDPKFMPTMHYDAQAIVRALSPTPDVLERLDELVHTGQAPTGTGRMLADAFASPNAPDTGRYNEILINAAVLYVAHTTLQSTKNHLLANRSVHDPLVELYHAVLPEIEPEGRYLMLSAAASQLRYPSHHTAYFHALFVVLYTREEAFVREQILRVLLERVIVHRPHPWGLLYTFAQLLRTHSVPLPQAPPEIHAILEHMSKMLAPERAVSASA